MAMMRTEAFKKRVAKWMRRGHFIPEMAIILIKPLPVVAKDKGAKAALLKELRSIKKQHDDAYRRFKRAADALERLSVSRALMPRHGLEGW